LKKLAAVAAVVVLIAAASLVLLIRSTFPAAAGTVRVAGVSAPVFLETDARGFPVVRARTPEDAVFGLGFVHARDRLWQMDFQRRIASGRLSEILGPRAVPTDRFLRTIGFRRAAERALASLSPETRRLLDAYARGANAYLTADRARPIEYRLLRAAPEPFQPVDSLAWAKVMAWDLASGNSTAEIRRARIRSALGEEAADELVPEPPREPTILQAGEWTPPSPRRPEPRSAVIAPPPGLERELDRLAELGLGGEEIGSNSWVVAGSRTRSGRPLLANDPHLGLRTPSVWYVATLDAPGLSATGATLPGVPAVIIGHNARIAWGLTSLEPDVQDLFLEKADPADPSRYFHRGSWLRFEERAEEIRVRGAAPVRLTVRSSVHGPLVTDLLAGAEALGAPVALAWTGFDPDDRTAEAFLAVDRAGDWAEFLDAVSRLHAPGQNWIYADVDGHIGYTASGAIPIRPRADGRLPVSGAGDDDWQGRMPFEQLPRVLDPARGFLVTANNRVAEWGGPDPINAEWVEPYRARRIRDLILGAAGKLTAEDMAGIQADRVSYQARDLLPLLLTTKPRDADSAAALARLARWDGEFARGSAPAAIYAAWYTELARLPDRRIAREVLGTTRSRFLLRAFSGPSRWCGTDERCAAFRADALAAALRLLRDRLGRDPDKWRWADLHRARLPHGVFDGVGLLRRLFSLETGQGGDASTVNVGAYRLDGTFRMSEGPSYRQVVDLGRPPAAVVVHPGGQSGNPFSPGYRDLLAPWRDGRLFPVPSPAVRVLELQPDGAGGGR
jgi:penicillin amidase